MISYVTIGVNDVAKAKVFYDAVLGALGHRRVYETETWLGYTDALGNYMPRIWVCNPIDGNPATVGNGSMVGLHAKSPAEVDRFHAVGLAHGGANEGSPGRRTRYQPGYYI
ncbi:MAG: VOC family protein [Deltaproteobacteria bacterium]|nr:VOC family protein [Deltaproteobacteria bacterium]